MIAQSRSTLQQQVVNTLLNARPIDVPSVSAQANVSAAGRTGAGDTNGRAS
jgi:hypothetical protein